MSIEHFLGPSKDYQLGLTQDIGFHRNRTYYLLDNGSIGGYWESTQTIAPDNIITGSPMEFSIQLDWTPILYTADSGGYEVYYGESQGGPYTYFDVTADKTISSMEVTGLLPETTYYFVVQSVTDPHAHNQNTVRSEASSTVSGSTLAEVPTVGFGGLLVLVSILTSLICVFTRQRYRVDE